MRFTSLLLAGTAIASSTAAIAADQLKFGPLPAWVAEQVVPSPSDKAKDRPVALLLHDQQNLLEPGKISTYSELAFKIQKPEGLAAGNLSITWNPAFDTVTVNRLEVRRGNQVIDVLKSGQTFTTMRRESNLELAMLDGMLTANIQPEGLQEGDVVLFATTTEHVDPTLKGHVEANFAPWAGAQIGLAHARIAWPSNVGLKLQKMGDLPAPQESARDGKKTYELTMRDVEPVIDPKGAPVRFKIGRMGEASDFGSWADAARLMAPLYRDVAVIPATGPLRDEVEKIRKASTDPKVRAEQALQLVQDRVRYVALLMGQGGYVPASAETTWSRRFGDCKAKTALLLSVLHELGIQAEPVLANPFLGDLIGDGLPMIGLFNHVLVRAHVANKDYWLDGTRSGDSDLDSIEVPDFGWGLPLIENAQLVHMVPGPRSSPSAERRVNVDARAGVYAPAPVTIEEIYRGDSSVQMNAAYSALSSDQRDEQMRDKGREYFDTFTTETSSLQFDSAKREIRIKIQGTAKLGWKDGWVYVPTSSIAFTPDFDRPAGPLHDVPMEVNHPRFVKDIVTMNLPQGFAAQQQLHRAVHETLAGVEYARTETVNGDVLTVESSERSVTPEIPYAEALAAAPRLKVLDKDDVYLKITRDYRATDKDLAARASDTPSSAWEYSDRGGLYLDRYKYDEAVADFTEALKLEPDDEWAHVDRGLAYVWKRKFDEAEKDLAFVESHNPKNPVLLRARGLMAEFKDDCATSVDFFTRSLAEEDSNFAVGQRATCEADIGKYDAALADSAAALKKDPQWMNLRILRANIFIRRGDHAGVAAEAEALLHENPKSDFALVAAAKTYAALDQRQRAMQLFDQAIAIKPTALTYVNRSQVRPASDITGKMADLDAALRLEPDNVDAIAVKADLLSKQGKQADALALLDRLPKSTADEAWVQRLQAVMLYKAGRTAEAQKRFADLGTKSKTASEFNSLCWMKATAGMLLESALSDCQNALKMSPDSGPYLDSLGMVLLKLGKLDEALDAYTKAIAKNTGADSLMGRAFVYMRKGDRAHADADAAAARKLYAMIDDTFAEYGLKFDDKSARAATAK